MFAARHCGGKANFTYMRTSNYLFYVLCVEKKLYISQIFLIMFATAAVVSLAEFLNIIFVFKILSTKIYSEIIKMEIVVCIYLNILTSQ